MIKSFPIDFIRQTFEQTFAIEHIKNINLFGGKDQINIFSFYEQLKNQDEVDRFVENYRDLADQQNRTGLIGNGVLVSPENPTITNLYSCLIIPFSYTCSIRCTLENRDQMLATINNLIEELKGSKVDIAQLECVDENGHPYTQPFMVGTIGHNNGAPILKDGDYVGTINSVDDKNTVIANLTANGITLNTLEDYYVYCTNNSQLKVCRLWFYGSQQVWTYTILENDGSVGRIIFPPEHTSFEKYKLSLSFDSLRCDEPRTLNSQEYCEISFGGSATLVNNGVKLGNDLIKISVSKLMIKAKNNITFADNITFLEPLEMPSGSSPNTKISQLVSNKFISNTHTDSLALSLQYTFIADENIDLISQWFDYARYGTQGLTVNDISPNMIYTIKEYWSSWGSFIIKEIKAKIVEDIEIENTESDTLTLGIRFQVQGDN